MIVIEIPRARARFNFQTSTHWVVVVFFASLAAREKRSSLYHRRRHPTDKDDG
jgi:hypothetical protein